MNAILLSCSPVSFLSNNLREVVIYEDGSCHLPIVLTVTGQCKSQIKLFPNDIHQCTFLFYMFNVFESDGVLGFELGNNGNGTSSGAWHFNS